MTRQNIFLGTVANDGTGDSLRDALDKVNDNFVDLYLNFGGDSDTLNGPLTITADGTIPVNVQFVDCFKASALALILPSGSFQGENIVFTNRGVGTATITPTNFAHGTSFAISTNESCTTTWDGLNWFISGNISVATIV